MARLVAIVLLVVAVVTTFGPWRNGLLTFGVPPSLSGAVAAVGGALLVLSVVALQADIGRAPQRMLAARKGWPVLLVGVTELLALGLLAGLYVWVCDRGGGDVFFVP